MNDQENIDTSRLQFPLFFSSHPFRYLPRLHSLHLFSSCISPSIYLSSHLLLLTPWCRLILIIRLSNVLREFPEPSGNPFLFLPGRTESFPLVGIEGLLCNYSLTGGHPVVRIGPLWQALVVSHEDVVVWMGSLVSHAGRTPAFLVCVSLGVGFACGSKGMRTG